MVKGWPRDPSASPAGGRWVGTLEWLLAREVDRNVLEGRCHTGAASVVQLVARRPINDTHQSSTETG